MSAQSEATAVGGEAGEAVDWSAAPRPCIVFVSGCYDLLHSGHVRFFKEASALGALYVSVGNDANILALKKHRAMFPEQERQFMVQVRNFKKF